MRKITTTLTAISFLCLLSIGIMAKSGDLKEHVTITQQIWVNDTLVKPGKYLIRYDAAMGLVKIMDGNDVVAQAKATVTMNDEKFDQDAILLNTTAKGDMLIGVRLGGQREELHLSELTAETDTYNFDFHKYQDFGPDMDW
jgi:outer membrane lipoprotein-sorting protein